MTGHNLVDYVASLVNADWALKAYGEEMIRRYATIDAAYGPLRVVENNLAEFWYRCILVQMGVPTALFHLRGADVQPDIIFLDALKRTEEPLDAHATFPDAIICGEDWPRREEKGNYPIRAFAADLTKRGGGTLFAYRATFVISESRHGLTLDERLIVRVSDF